MSDPRPAPPLHHGDPLGEQRAIVEQGGIVDVGDVGVLQVSGPDAATFLSSLLARRVTDMTAGASCEALLLDPTGHIRAALGVVARANDFLLLTPPGLAAHLADWFASMRFLLRVRIDDLSSDFHPLAIIPSADALPQGVLPASTPIWRDPWSSVAPQGIQYSGENPERDRWRLDVALCTLDSAHAITTSGQPGGLRLAGSLALDALRIAAWRPRTATEAADGVLPHELDWLRTAVELERGCYPGQETVSKVHNLGRPPRRLVLLELDGSEGVLPPQGAVVSCDGGEVGHVTTSALHWERGPIALGLVRRTVPVRAVLEVRGPEDELIAAAQEVIVPPEAGGTVRDEISQFRRARRGR